MVFSAPDENVKTDVIATDTNVMDQNIESKNDEDEPEEDNEIKEEVLSKVSEEIYYKTYPVLSSEEAAIAKIVDLEKKFGINPNIPIAPDGFIPNSEVRRLPPYYGISSGLSRSHLDDRDLHRPDSLESDEKMFMKKLDEYFKQHNIPLIGTGELPFHRLGKKKKKPRKPAAVSVQLMVDEDGQEELVDSSYQESMKSSREVEARKEEEKKEVKAKRITKAALREEKERKRKDVERDKRHESAKLFEAHGIFDDDHGELQTHLFDSDVHRVLNQLATDLGGWKLVYKTLDRVLDGDKRAFIQIRTIVKDPDTVPAVVEAVNQPPYAYGFLATILGSDNKAMELLDHVQNNKAGARQLLQKTLYSEEKADRFHESFYQARSEIIASLKKQHQHHCLSVGPNFNFYIDESLRGSHGSMEHFAKFLNGDVPAARDIIDCLRKCKLERALKILEDLGDLTLQSERMRNRSLLALDTADTKVTYTSTDEDEYDLEKQHQFGYLDTISTTTAMSAASERERSSISSVDSLEDSPELSRIDIDSDKGALFEKLPPLPQFSEENWQRHLALQLAHAFGDRSKKEVLQKQVAHILKIDEDILVQIQELDVEDPDKFIKEAYAKRMEVIEALTKHVGSKLRAIEILNDALNMEKSALKIVKEVLGKDQNTDDILTQLRVAKVKVMEQLMNNISDDVDLDATDLTNVFQFDSSIRDAMQVALSAACEETLIREREKAQRFLHGFFMHLEYSFNILSERIIHDLPLDPDGALEARAKEELDEETVEGIGHFVTYFREDIINTLEKRIPPLEGKSVKDWLAKGNRFLDNVEARKMRYVHQILKTLNENKGYQNTFHPEKMKQLRLSLFSKGEVTRVRTPSSAEARPSVMKKGKKSRLRKLRKGDKYGERGSRASSSGSGETSASMGGTDDTESFRFDAETGLSLDLDRFEKRHEQLSQLKSSIEEMSLENLMEAIKFFDTDECKSILDTPITDQIMRYLNQMKDKPGNLTEKDLKAMKNFILGHLDRAIEWVKDVEDDRDSYEESFGDRSSIRNEMLKRMHEMLFYDHDKLNEKLEAFMQSDDWKLAQDSEECKELRSRLNEIKGLLQTADPKHLPAVISDLSRKLKSEIKKKLETTESDAIFDVTSPDHKIIMEKDTPIMVHRKAHGSDKESSKTRRREKDLDARRPDGKKRSPRKEMRTETEEDDKVSQYETGDVKGLIKHATDVGGGGTLRATTKMTSPFHEPTPLATQALQSTSQRHSPGEFLTDKKHELPSKDDLDVGIDPLRLHVLSKLQDKQATKESKKTARQKATGRKAGDRGLTSDGTEMRLDAKKVRVKVGRYALEESSSDEDAPRKGTSKSSKVSSMEGSEGTKEGHVEGKGRKGAKRKAAKKGMNAEKITTAALVSISSGSDEKLNEGIRGGKMVARKIIPRETQMDDLRMKAKPMESFMKKGDKTNVEEQAFSSKSPFKTTVSKDDEMVMDDEFGKMRDLDVLSGGKDKRLEDTDQAKARDLGAQQSLGRFKESRKGTTGILDNISSVSDDTGKVKGRVDTLKATPTLPKGFQKSGVGKRGVLDVSSDESDRNLKVKADTEKQAAKQMIPKGFQKSGVGKRGVLDVSSDESDRNVKVKVDTEKRAARQRIPKGGLHISSDASDDRRQKGKHIRPGKKTQKTPRRKVRSLDGSSDMSDDRFLPRQMEVDTAATAGVIPAEDDENVGDEQKDDMFPEYSEMSDNLYSKTDTEQQAQESMQEHSKRDDLMRLGSSDSFDEERKSDFIGEKDNILTFQEVPDCISELSSDRESKTKEFATGVKFMESESETDSEFDEAFEKRERDSSESDSLKVTIDEKKWIAKTVKKPKKRLDELTSGIPQSLDDCVYSLMEYLQTCPTSSMHRELVSDLCHLHNDFNLRDSVKKRINDMLSTELDGIITKDLPKINQLVKLNTLPGSQLQLTKENVEDIDSKQQERKKIIEGQCRDVLQRAFNLIDGLNVINNGQDERKYLLDNFIEHFTKEGYWDNERTRQLQRGNILRSEKLTKDQLPSLFEKYKIGRNIEKVSGTDTGNILSHVSKKKEESPLIQKELPVLPLDMEELEDVFKQDTDYEENFQQVEAEKSPTNTTTSTISLPNIKPLPKDQEPKTETEDVVQSTSLTHQEQPNQITHDDMIRDIMTDVLDEIDEGLEDYEIASLALSDSVDVKSRKKGRLSALLEAIQDNPDLVRIFNRILARREYTYEPSRGIMSLLPGYYHPERFPGKIKESAVEALTDKGRQKLLLKQKKELEFSGALPSFGDAMFQSRLPPALPSIHEGSCFTHKFYLSHAASTDPLFQHGSNADTIKQSKKQDRPTFHRLSSIPVNDWCRITISNLEWKRENFKCRGHAHPNHHCSYEYISRRVHPDFRVQTGKLLGNLEFLDMMNACIYSSAKRRHGKLGNENESLLKLTKRFQKVRERIANRERSRFCQGSH